MHFKTTEIKQVNLTINLYLQISPLLKLLSQNYLILYLHLKTNIECFKKQNLDYKIINDMVYGKMQKS